MLCGEGEGDVKIERERERYQRKKSREVLWKDVVHKKGYGFTFKFWILRREFLTVSLSRVKFG